VYVTNGLSGNVAQYAVGAAGALTPKDPATVSAGAQPRGIAVSPDGRSVYVANIGSNTVSQYDVGADGALMPKSPPTVAGGGTFGGPFSVAVSPDGESAYVTNVFTDTIAQYDVEPGGRLLPKGVPTVGTGHGPQGVAVGPLPRVPTSKEQCKKGGWRRFGFENQGQCIRFVKRGPKP
jgi:DNA-binding beta-propeller fold protein YncE